MKKLIISTIKTLILSGVFFVHHTYSATCNAIGSPITATDGGIFSLASFDDKLYIGMFGYDYHHKYPNGPFTPDDVMVYRLNGNSLTPTDLTKARLSNSESICAMREFKGELHIASERAGKNFKTTNLSVASTDNKVQRDICDYHDNGEYLVGAETHGGTVLYTNNGSTFNKSTVSTAGNPYFREVTYFKGYWYVYGYRRSDLVRIGFRSSDLQSWVPVPVPGRVFRTNIINGTLWLSIARTPPKGSDDKIALYSTEDGINYTPRYRSLHNTYSHLSEVHSVLINGKKKLIATASRGFKPLENNFNNEGASALIQFSEDGAYEEHLCEFANQEFADATTWHDNKLYIGTMHRGYESDDNRGGGSGRLYEVDGIVQAPSNIIFIEYDDYLIPIIN